MSESPEVLAAAFANGPVYCEYCGRRCHENVTGDQTFRATIDHRIPTSRGGRRCRANIAIACFRCNHDKGLLTEEEFRLARRDGIDTRILHARIHNAVDGRPVYASREERRDAKRARRERQLAERAASERIEA